jgi:hypothetical protein
MLEVAMLTTIVVAQWITAMQLLEHDEYAVRGVAWVRSIGR